MKYEVNPEAIFFGYILIMLLSYPHRDCPAAILMK